MGTLIEQRAAALQAAQDIIDRATKASRDFTAEETAEVERHQAQVVSLDKKIKRQDRVKQVLALGSADDDPDGGGFKALSPEQWAAKAARRMRGITDDDTGTLPTKAVQSGSWTLP